MAGGPAAARVVAVRPVMGGWADETEVEFVSPRLPAAFDGLTAAQVTDTHLRPGHPRAGALGEYVAGQSPDLWLFTGDLFERSTATHEVATLLAAARASMGVYVVLGNNDNRALERDATLVDVMRAAGARVLIDEAHRLERDGARIWIAGVDDPSRDRDDLSKALAGTCDHEFRLLLAHSIDIRKPAAAAGVDFVVCGHSHGGQMCLPWIGPVISGAKQPSSPRLARGVHRFDNTWAYVCRGTGTSKIPVRLWCRPEVTRYRFVRDPG